MAKQISVFLENKAGRLSRVTRVLGDASINIRALSLADTSDFGILRIIVNDPDKAYEILKAADFTVSITEVVAVQLLDKPGSLADMLDHLAEVNLNIEYLYAFLGGGNNAVVVLKVEDAEKAVESFKAEGIAYIEGERLYEL